MKGMVLCCCRRCFRCCCCCGRAIHSAAWRHDGKLSYVVVVAVNSTQGHDYCCRNSHHPLPLQIGIQHPRVSTTTMLAKRCEILLRSHHLLGGNMSSCHWAREYLHPYVYINFISRSPVPGNCNKKNATENHGNWEKASKKHKLRFLEKENEKLRFLETETFFVKLFRKTTVFGNYPYAYE